MPHIRQNLIIGASSEIIYNAITSQEGLSVWWTPGSIAKAEPNSIAHFPFGDDYFKEMRITALSTNELVKWECIKGGHEWIGTTISFSLISNDKQNLLNTHPPMRGQLEQLNKEQGTILIFQHDDWKEYSQMFAECSYTWGQFLRSLKLLCETGIGRPWPDQHRS